MFQGCLLLLYSLTCVCTLIFGFTLQLFTSLYSAFPLPMPLPFVALAKGKVVDPMSLWSAGLFGLMGELSELEQGWMGVLLLETGTKSCLDTGT